MQLYRWDHIINNERLVHALTGISDRPPNKTALGPGKGCKAAEPRLALRPSACLTRLDSSPDTSLVITETLFMWRTLLISVALEKPIILHFVLEGEWQTESDWKLSVGVRNVTALRLLKICCLFHYLPQMKHLNNDENITSDSSFSSCSRKVWISRRSACDAGWILTWFSGSSAFQRAFLQEEHTLTQFDGRLNQSV